MNRRQFLGLGLGLVAAIAAATVAEVAEPEPVQVQAAPPQRELMTRGTYAGWSQPGVPPW